VFSHSHVPFATQDAFFSILLDPREESLVPSPQALVVQRPSPSPVAKR
jgi:hypothetical protein